MIDRSAIATAVAKTLAYLACGKQALAYEHARVLIGLLRQAGLRDL